MCRTQNTWLVGVLCHPVHMDVVQESSDNLPEDFWDCTTTTYLLCFDKVEWHATDRVKLQFGLPQNIPGDPVDMRQYHKLNKRFKSWYTSNGYRFPQESEHWDNRR